MTSPTASDRGTRWRVENSRLLDLVCLTGILSGDPSYASLYPEECERLHPRLDAETREAVRVIDRIVKELGGVTPAVLADAASQTRATTLTGFAAELEQEDLGEGVEDLGAAICAAARGFERAGFEEDWRENVEPKITPHLEPLRSYLSQHDIVPLVQRKLGFSLASDEITVYVLHYSKPHSMRLAGTSFATYWAYPARRIPRNAIHELMHPPFAWHEDAELRAALEPLRADAYLMDRVENHNPSFGYTSFEGFVEEDAIQALDQLLNDDIEGADDPRDRWRGSDDGMHVLAVALYDQMRKDCFVEDAKSLRDYLVHLGAVGLFRPGWVEERHRQFYR